MNTPPNPEPAAATWRAAQDRARWSALQRRAAFALRGDGSQDYFFYGVTSTGVVCRPDCPSRRPRAANTRFFDTVQQAHAAGFRLCLRCKPLGKSAAEQAAERVERVRLHLEQHSDDGIPSLKQLAQLAHLSPFHLQRCFRAVLGVSPAAYARQVRQQHFAAKLTGGTVTEAIYAAGFQSASAAYRPGAAAGMTPSARRQRGARQDIRYTLADSPLGRMLVAATPRGVCAVAFGDRDADLLADLQHSFSQATLVDDNGTLASDVAAVLGHLTESQAAEHLSLDVRATAFQQRVWDALRRIPRGTTRTYAEVAAALGQPTAVRAVARACASNPVAVVVPCHRVIGKDGALTGYRWGVERKRKLLGLEQNKSV